MGVYSMRNQWKKYQLSAVCVWGSGVDPGVIFQSFQKLMSEILFLE